MFAMFARLNEGGLNEGLNEGLTMVLGDTSTSLSGLDLARVSMGRHQTMRRDIDTWWII